MGIKIIKPEIYLGNKKISTISISNKYKSQIKNKIGSKYVHIETKKNILEMATFVAKKLLKKEKLSAEFLIFVSQGQDKIFPSAAEKLAKNLNLSKNTLVFTLSSGCSGFVQALILSDSLLKTKYKNGLIVCAEKYSKYMEKNNVKTRLLFSDAASATLVLRSNQENILGIDHGYNGSDSDSLKVDDLTGKNLLTMDGSKVFLFGISTIPESIKKLNKSNHVDKYLIHNGSKIMLDTIIKKSNILLYKKNLSENEEIKNKNVINSFNITGNTISSSIPLLVNISYNELIGKNVLMSGFGVGLSWASILIKWI